MNKQNDKKNQIRLDNYSKQKLAHAYMSLYDALVAECQSKNMTLGKSWYNALKRIHEIMNSKKSEKQNIVLDYLMDFYNSHRKTQLKKMMIAKDKDLTIQTDIKKAKAATALVETELKKFDAAMESVMDTDVLVVLKQVQPQPTKGFYNWVENQPGETVVDFNDPHSFERAYKRYILQQKGK